MLCSTFASRPLLLQQIFPGESPQLRCILFDPIAICAHLLLSTCELTRPRQRGIRPKDYQSDLAILGEPVFTTNIVIRPQPNLN
jgi:hypothetical protein